MRSGPARSRIVVEEATETRDKYGAVDLTWATFGTYWAEVIFRGGGEALNTMREVTQADLVFRMRYRSTITEKMRVKYKTRYFDIVRIDNPGSKNQVTEIYGVETR